MLGRGTREEGRMPHSVGHGGRGSGLDPEDLGSSLLGPLSRTQGDCGLSYSAHPGKDLNTRIVHGLHKGSEDAITAQHGLREPSEGSLY